ncbi:MAG: Crp/Fnr family transcriptional regulator [Moraxellaceae bacterium]|nr:Crp/Fnr family transcriptional regulator [Moraxellaceae bacterium]MDZ4385742.1 Crp/Fnr family transcriptional regulator [Moraxellaceae bacterium]
MSGSTAVDPEALGHFLRQWLSIDDVQLDDMLDYVRPCHYARHALLFHEGETVDDLVLMGTGLARSFTVREDREVNLRLLCAPAAALPFSSFLSRTPADETLQALTDISGYRLRFRRYCQHHPGLLAESMQRLLAERHFIALQRRLHMLQAGAASARYAYFLKHMEPEIVSGTPAYHVASYLGITPESLSRVKADLDK